MASVSFRRRARALSTQQRSARAGFADFFLDHGGVGDVGGVNTCSDMDSGCHALPLQVSTNGPVLQGFDAPTLRGLNDRFVQFSIGIDSAEEAMVAAIDGGPLPFIGITLTSPPSPRPWDPEQGFEERSRSPRRSGLHRIYNTGPLASRDAAGARHRLLRRDRRQVTLSPETAAGADTAALLAALEAAHRRAS